MHSLHLTKESIKKNKFHSHFLANKMARIQSAAYHAILWSADKKQFGPQKTKHDTLGASLCSLCMLSEHLEIWYCKTMDNKEKKNSNNEEDEEGERREPKTFMGIFTREQFIMLCIGIGLIALLLIITLTSVFVIMRSGMELFSIFLFYDIEYWLI